MTQSRLESLVEALLNIGSGYLLSLLVWVYIAAPLFGIPVSWGESFLLNGLFTVVSVSRSYAWRRYFNARIHRRIHQWTQRTQNSGTHSADATTAS